MSLKEKVLNLQLEKTKREKEHYEEQVKNHEKLILAYESGKEYKSEDTDIDDKTTIDSLSILKSTVARLEKDLESQTSYSDELLELVENQDNSEEVNTKVDELKEAKRDLTYKLESLKDTLKNKDLKIAELQDKVEKLTDSLKYERETLLELQEVNKSKDSIEVVPDLGHPAEEEIRLSYEKKIADLTVKYEKEVSDAQLGALNTIRDLKDTIKSLEADKAKDLSIPSESDSIDRLTRANLELQEQLELAQHMLGLKDKEIEELEANSDIDKYLELEKKYEDLMEKYKSIMEIGNEDMVEGQEEQAVKSEEQPKKDGMGDILELQAEEIPEKKGIFFRRG